MKKANIIARLFFPHFQFYLLLLLPVTFFGFFPTYITRPFEDFKAVFHIHAVLMVLWLLLAVTQPFLIANRKFHTHRNLGRLSYLIMPLIILSGYMVISFTYRQFAAGERMQALSFWPEEWTLLQKSAASAVIGSIYLVWLLLYYSLGIIHRKKTMVHGMYMLAATLTVLGPSGDRLVGHIFEKMGWGYNMFAEYFIFVFVAVFFAALSIHQYRKGLSVKPTLLILAIHITGMIFYHQLPYSRSWTYIAERLF